MTLSHESDPRALVPGDSVSDRDAHRLSDGDLDRLIRGGWDVWCDLLDDMLNTGGMLPSRELAGRVTSFFEDVYWRAEEARTEALRRQMATLSAARSHRGSDRSLGLA